MGLHYSIYAADRTNSSESPLLRIFRVRGPASRAHRSEHYYFIGFIIDLGSVL